MCSLALRPRAVRRAVLLALLALWLTACARPSIPVETLPQAIDAPPEWRPGDRWVYDLRSGSETGSKSVEILEIKEVNTLPYYVVRIGESEHYYTSELHWAGSVRGATVESRMTPPHPWFVWPLEVGRRWVHRGAYEDVRVRQQHNDTFAVMAREMIQVPAGRFSALKVVREGSRSEYDQYWFVPEVRWYARWVGRRGQEEFEEQLREYHPAPRLIPK